MLPQAILDLAEQLAQLPGFGRRSSQKVALDLLQLPESQFLDLLQKLQDARRQVLFCQNCGFFAQKEDKEHLETNFLSNLGISTKQALLCSICKNYKRDPYQICLVEKPTDVLNIEKSQIYFGHYHVLKKLISPLENVYADQTTIADLFDRRLVNLIKNLTSQFPQSFSQIRNLKQVQTQTAINSQISETEKLSTKTQEKEEYLLKSNFIEKQIELIVFFREGFAAQSTIAYLQELIQARNWQAYIKISKLAQGLPLYYNPDNLDQATICKALEERREIGR